MSDNPRFSGLDRVDRAIVRALQANGRISFAEVGKQVGLSPSTAAERIRRLEQDGVIEGYTARLSLRRVGFPLVAFILVRPKGPDARFVKLAGERAEILECHRVTGDVSFVVRAAAADMENLEEILNHIEPSSSYVETLVVLSTGFERPVSVPETDRGLSA